MWITETVALGSERAGPGAVGRAGSFNPPAEEHRSSRRRFRSRATDLHYWKKALLRSWFGLIEPGRPAIYVRLLGTVVLGPAPRLMFDNFIPVPDALRIPVFLPFGIKASRVYVRFAFKSDS